MLFTDCCGSIKILGYKDKGGLKHSLLQNPTYVGEISADLSDRVQSGRRQARKGSSVLPPVGSRETLCC